MSNRATSFESPPPGFTGLDPAKPVTIYRRHLPHLRQDGATYFVTFRLNDSLPREHIKELVAQREAWLRAHPSPTEAEWLAFSREAFAHLDRWLDQGMGSCALAEESARVCLEETLRHFDGERYRLGAFTVMPNHVHVVVRPEGAHALEQIVQSWKRQAARTINEQNGRGGALWQEESYDHIVRDAPGLRRTVGYIARHPQRAGIEAPVWIRPDWLDWFECCGAELYSDGAGCRSATPAHRIPAGALNSRSELHSDETKDDGVQLRPTRQLRGRSELHSDALR